MVTFEALAFCDLVQCLHKRLGIIPRYCFHRAVIVLKTRRVIAVHHRFPQSLGYRILANIKIGDGDQVLGFFIVVGIFITLRAAHHKAAAGDWDHLEWVAVGGCFEWFGHIILLRINQKNEAAGLSIVLHKLPLRPRVRTLRLADQLVVKLHYFF